MFCGADVLHIFLSHLGSRIKENNFKLPSINFIVEALHEVKKEKSSSQNDQPIQEGKWLKILAQTHYAKASVGKLKKEGVVTLIYYSDQYISLLVEQKFF